MGTTAIILIVVAVIAVLAVVAFVVIRQRARQLDQKRVEAREHREQADTSGRKAEQARLAAEEQADRARKEQTAAKEHRQQAQEIDPDVEECGVCGASTRTLRAIARRGAAARSWGNAPRAWRPYRRGAAAETKAGPLNVPARFSNA